MGVLGGVLPLVSPYQDTIWGLDHEVSPTVGNWITNPHLGRKLDHEFSPRGGNWIMNSPQRDETGSQILT